MDTIMFLAMVVAVVGLAAAITWALSTSPEPTEDWMSRL